ncbi:MAG TPA: DNA-directed RNA polymerase subunit omega [Ruminococcaceae bacterium]|nr:DNA-directed RNA polymerase subunit omega [Oscillospiraceae bacterium]
MLNPSIGKLLKMYDSRYQLVIDVARHARKIADQMAGDTDAPTEKPVDLALYDLVKAGAGEEQYRRIY